jgi:hypothetical protein
MATDNPTGGDGTVALNLTDKQQRYLYCTFSYCKLGREEDLRTHPDDPNAGKWRAVADAYGRLLDGVEAGEIVPDPEVRRLVRELAAAMDREEEWERVVFEHHALAALRDQIGTGP